MTRVRRLVVLPLGGLALALATWLTPAEADLPTAALPPIVKADVIVIPGTLTRNDPVERVPNGRRRKSHVIAMTGGRVYQIDLESKQVPSMVRVENARGVPVGLGQVRAGLSSRVVFPVPLDGDYRVVVTTQQPNAEGPYTLRVQALEILGNPLAQSGQLTKDDLVDRQPTLKHHKLHTVRMLAGRTYQLDLMSTAFDAFLRLEDRKGNQLAQDDDSGGNRNARILYKSPRDQELLVVATSLGPNMVGAYTLAIQELTGGGQQGKGDEFQGQLTPNDPHDKMRQGCHHKVHSYKMEAGRTYRIDLMSAAFDTFLRVEDSKGANLAQDDDGGDGLNSRLMFKAPRTDTYRIIATTCGSGAVGPYTLSVLPFAATIAGNADTRQYQLTKKDPFDRVPAQRRYKAFPLRLTAGRTYLIDLESKDFDTFLRLEGSNGALLGQDDDGGDGLNSRLVHQAQGDDDTRLIVTSTGQGFGTFALKVQELGVKDQPQPPITGRISKDDPFDRQNARPNHRIHHVKLTGGRSYLVDLMSKDFDPFLRVEDAAGNQLAQDDDSGGGRNARLRFRAAQEGIYRFSVSNVGNGVGNYTLRIQPLEEQPGNGISSQLTTADPFDKRRQGCHHKVHLVPMQAARSYTIDLESSAFDTYLRLEDSKGVQLAENDDGGNGSNARIVFTPKVTDEYRVIATSFGQGATGPYVLKVRTSSTPAATGQLTKNDPIDRVRQGCHSKIHPQKMLARRTYTIDLESTDFDSYLRVEDARGNALAEDDDGGNGNNARIVFRPPQDGDYRIIVTTFNPGAVGRYNLMVR